jgi:hypothetical protein
MIEFTCVIGLKTPADRMLGVAVAIPLIKIKLTLLGFDFGSEPVAWTTLAIGFVAYRYWRAIPDWHLDGALDSNSHPH